MLLAVSSCSSNNKENDVPIYSTRDSLQACEHISEYHTIPSALIRYVGNEKYEREFNEVYKDTEGHNIVNFIKHFDITKDEFNTLIANYGLKLNATTDFDVELLYSSDDDKVQEYFKKK